MLIEDLIEKIKDRKIKWRGHASKRAIERNIFSDDVLQAIVSGEIIEEYPEDFPFPSCLVLGYTEDKRPLHIVSAVGQDYIWIITVYIPDLKKWSNNYTKRSK